MTKNYLDLPDEDILNMAFPDEEQEEEKQEEDTIEDDVEEVKETPVDEVVDTEEASEEDNKKDETVENIVENKEAEKNEVEEPQEDKIIEPTINYEEEYKKLLAPLRANNKDIVVSNIDDARTLMQMGANYNKKMAALKPNLKVMKMLENNDLLNEERLNFLIDLDKKNPDAIAKLLKDSNINPLDIDVAKDSEYKSKSYSVDDGQIAVEEVLNEIKHTETYQKTINAITKEWDTDSQNALLKEPSLIRDLNTHMSNGMYEKIFTQIERERMLGRLVGVSDIAAYQQIGNQLYANKAQEAPVANVVVQPVSKPVENPKIKEQKRAAAPTKSIVNNKPSGEFNPLSLSDEEFLKQSSLRYN